MTLSPTLAGTLAPIASIAHARTGKRPSRQAIWRWIRKGICGGVRLDAVHSAGQWMTTAEAFEEFLAAQTEAMLQPRETVPPASDDDLRAAGLL